MVSEKASGPTQRLRIIDAMNAHRLVVSITTPDEFYLIAWHELSPVRSDRGRVSLLPAASVLAQVAADDGRKLPRLRTATQQGDAYWGNVNRGVVVGATGQHGPGDQRSI
jgi:hypothetical protein